MSKVESALAEFASRGRDWSPRAFQLAVSAIGDTIAGGVAGKAERQTLALARSLGLAEGASGLPAPLGNCTMPDAAFLGAVACHALDWNDYMLPMYGHCSTVLLPAVWSVGLAQGRSGHDLVEAFLVGYQVDYILSLFFGRDHYDHGWHPTNTIGTVGAAAAAARMLRLDVAAAGNALAIASSFGSGLKCNFGTDTEAMQVGAAARNGVQAALLAAQGVSASADWLTGRFGMLPTFGGAVVDPVQVETIFDGVDLDLNGIESESGLIQRPYTCCGACHAILDAVIDQAAALRADGIGVEEVRLNVDPSITKMMFVDNPDSPTAANCSLTWSVAAAAVDLTAGPNQFSWEALERPDIRALRDRIVVIPDRANPAATPFAATVSVSGGSRHSSMSVVHGRGHPLNPMSADLMRGKQHEALDAVIGGENAERLIGTLADIVRLPTLQPLEILALRISH